MSRFMTPPSPSPDDSALLVSSSRGDPSNPLLFLLQYLHWSALKRMNSPRRPLSQWRRRTRPTLARDRTSMAFDNGSKLSIKTDNGSLWYTIISIKTDNSSNWFTQMSMSNESATTNPDINGLFRLKTTMSVFTHALNWISSFLIFVHTFEIENIYKWLVLRRRALFCLWGVSLDHTEKITMIAW